MKYNDYELIYMVNENEEAFGCLLNKYEPLFKKISYSFYCKYKSIGVEYEELIQQCRLSLYTAIKKYNPEKDVLFYSYLMVYTNRILKNYIKVYSRKNRSHNYLDIENYNNEEFLSDDFSNNYIDYDFQKEITDFKNSLNYPESAVFELKYNNFSYREISILLEINEKKVDNILVKVRKKMEKYFLFS